MATAAPTRASFNRADTDRRVRHPLQALRGYIRMYVLIEGGLIALIYLSLWFWIGLLLDYGSFKLFGGWDWIQELQGITEESQTTDIVVRGVLLGILVAGLLAVVTVKVLLRLMREFRDTSLALVLERRFPKELGDRLITAVEMADPKLAVKYGFSSALVDKTINEAADRVEKVPVRQVFNWGRLRRLGLLVLGLTVGMYILMGGLSMGIAAIGGDGVSPTDTMWRSYHTASIWSERNLLLMNSYWPRQAFVELVRFQDTTDHPGEMRIGRDDQRPDLQARAYQWVVADSSDPKKAPGGWRPLKWADLPALLGPEMPGQVNIPQTWGGWVIDLEDVDKNIPSGVLPARWQGQTSGAIRQDLQKPEVREAIGLAGASKAVADLLDYTTWTMDKIAVQYNNSAVRGTLRVENPQALQALEALLAKVSELGKSASRERQIRQLAIPTGEDDIELAYWGKNTRRTDPPDPNRIKDNNFYFPLTDLKETVRFTVRAADFATPMQKITLVPPPTIASLVMDKEEPAYIYYRLQGDQAPLKGKKQLFKNVQAGVMGEVTTIHVPIGTNLTLTAKADRPVKNGVRMQKPFVSEERGAILPKSEVTLLGDNQTFVTRFDNIKKTIEFEFEFNDYDNVKGKRRILIRPIDDRAPEVFDVEMMAVLRKPRFKAEPGKTNLGGAVDGFLITPDALLPFKGTLRDDYGLTDAKWLYEVEPVDLELVGKSDKDKLPSLVLSGNVRMRRNALVVSGLQFFPGMPGSEIAAPAWFAWMSHVVSLDLAQGAKRLSVEGSTPLERFLNRLKDDSGEVTMNQLLENLKKKPPARPLFKEHSLKDEDGFDFKKYLPKLKVADATKEAQLHYQIKLSVTATDNNVETGPSTGRNKAPFTFLVVSENELLSQIFIEEENLRERLEKVILKLKNARTNLTDQIPKVSTPSGATDKVSDVFDAMSVVSIRIDDVRKALSDSGSGTRGIFADYSRILRELEVNRVGFDKGKKKIEEVRNKIVEPLEDVVNPNNGNFDQAERALAKLSEPLDEDVAKLRTAGAEDRGLLAAVDQRRPGHVKNAQELQEKVDRLVERLSAVLAAMEEGIIESQLIEQLLNIERTQREEARRLQLHHDNLVRILLQGLEGK